MMIFGSKSICKLWRETTPAVRRDALYFIIDQLEAFDSGLPRREAKLVERIDGIAVVSPFPCSVVRLLLVVIDFLIVVSHL
jgi:hypothetical protein